MGLDLGHFIPSFIQDSEFKDYIEVSKLSFSKEYINKHSKYIVEFDFGDFGKSDVIYLRHLGYQRGNMNTSFFKEFKNDALYLDLETVQKAYKYLIGNRYESLEAVQSNFKSNFIENFIVGDSIFHISW